MFNSTQPKQFHEVSSLLINSVLAILICLIVKSLSLYEQYIEQVQALDLNWIILISSKKKLHQNSTKFILR